MGSTQGPLLDWREAFKDADALPPDALPAERRARGKRFERILYGMFLEAKLEPRLSFRPTGEEIDGSLWLEGRTVLVEAKWTQDPHPASSIFQFRGKVDGKLVGSVGLFISMAGFSADAVDALVAGKELNVILADGDDIRSIVNGYVSARDAIRQKLRAAGDSGTPFAPLAQSTTAPAVVRRIVLVEGRLEAQILETLRVIHGNPAGISIVPSGGVSNMVPLLRDLIASSGSPERVTVVLSANEAEDTDLQALSDDLRQVIRASHPGTALLISVIRPSLAAMLGVDYLQPGRREERSGLSERAVSAALQDVDTAALYANDQMLRRAMKGAGIYLPY